MTLWELRNLLDDMAQEGECRDLEIMCFDPKVGGLAPVTACFVHGDVRHGLAAVLS